tara:strand:+ start:24 stop:305 length:282 start_codon:yes stop_codon:yes gene_type:complete
MKRLDNLRLFFNRFFNGGKSNRREMRMVFQWKRYLEWKDLTPEEKLSAKRFLFLPVFAYLIIEIFNQNFFLIVLFLIGYVLYKKLEKGGIVRK